MKCVFPYDRCEREVGALAESKHTGLCDEHAHELVLQLAEIVQQLDSDIQRMSAWAEREVRRHTYARQKLHAAGLPAFETTEVAGPLRRLACSVCKEGHYTFFARTSSDLGWWWEPTGEALCSRCLPYAVVEVQQL